MNRGRQTLSVLVVAGMILTAAPSASWAESNVPDPGAFFSAIVNPKAKGKKVSGFLTIAYDFGESPDIDACPSIFINNMFVVTTLQRHKNIKPFNRDFTDGSGSQVTAPFCFDDFQKQVDFVLALIQEEAIPHFFGPCGTPAKPCPPFEVKSIKQFLTSGTGAISMEIRLAVKAPGPSEDD